MLCRRTYQQTMFIETESDVSYIIIIIIIVPLFAQ